MCSMAVNWEFIINIIIIIFFLLLVLGVRTAP